ncbi:uncharacterized protein LOC132619954 [Lycium barbarum]|uniref:uncharacterized protein LOC132619954 n=1 Tax=Lycium barbarum TaxID=112863 RepID=UPI00293E9C26|nr:uncharacterized protein LOC132619954 [Lycium barbarum]
MVEMKFQPSRDRYHPYSQPERSTFRSDKGRSGPGPNAAVSDRRSNRVIVVVIDRIEGVRLLRIDPSQRDPNLICEYHGTHGHQTDNCKRLRDEVAQMIKNGHLQELLSERAKNHFKNRETSKRTEPEKPQHVINMIIGGAEVPQGLMLKKTKFSITQQKRTREYVPDGIISFSNEDAEGLIQPHKDALILPTVWVLNRFNMACETTKGKISLPVNAADIDQYTKFYVIDGEMRCNALLGRPWLHIMRAVPSTLHQLLKLPTPEGVKITHGEQPAAKEMFAVEKAVQTLKITMHEDVYEDKNTK